MSSLKDFPSFCWRPRIRIDFVEAVSNNYWKQLHFWRHIQTPMCKIILLPGMQEVFTAGTMQGSKVNEKQAYFCKASWWKKKRRQGCGLHHHSLNESTIESTVHKSTIWRLIPLSHFWGTYIWVPIRKTLQGFKATRGSVCRVK